MAPTEREDAPPSERTVVGARGSETRDVGRPPTMPGDPEVVEGAVIGRYTVLERMGSGGMGVVHAAYDPRLDRRVALKLLRPDHMDGSAEPSLAQARLLREAQAMAQLSHPQVVEVYDAGTAGDRVYIAMELVEGGTLRRWLHRRHDWREVLAMFVQAGRGLAAAHAAGLVHRDFKPDNVLIDRQGRAKVLDFGLALPQERPSSDRSSQSMTQGIPVIRSSSGEALASLRTEAGVVMGTPAYMAPEQHMGRELDHRADQYGFCAALYDALFGVRPFGGDTVQALLRAKRNGAMQTPTQGAEVPASVRRAIGRGLAHDPADRWPSMDALLAELAARVRPPRRGWVWGLGLATVGVGGLAFAMREPSACAGSSDRLAGIWDHARSSAVRRALLDTDVPYAEDTWERVESGLDDYAARWSRSHAAQCRAQLDASDGERIELDRRFACLERELRQLSAVVDVLAETDREVLPQAVPLVLELPSPAACDVQVDDPELALPHDDGAARRAAVLEGRLAKVETLIEAGRYAAAEQLAAQVHADALRLGHTPTSLRAQLVHGEALMQTGALERAEALWTEGVYDAGAAGLDRLVVRIAARLTYLVGNRLLRFEEAQRWARHSEAARARVDDDGRLEAELRSALGNALISSEPARAAEQLERAIALLERVHGADALPTAEARTALGQAYFALGRYEDSIAQYEGVLGVQQRLLGDEHPSVAITLGNLANSQYQLGRHAEALALREHVYRVLRSSLGPDHAHVGAALHSLGNSSMALQRYDEAIGYFRGAIAVRTRALGSDSADVAATMVNLGIVLGEQGRHEEALIELHRAEDLLERTVGAEHGWTASCRGGIANQLFDLGRFEEARVQWQRTIALRLRLHGPDHPALAYAQRGMGEVLVAMKRADEARAFLEAALTIQARGDTAPDDIAGTRFLLARALADSGGEGDRARAIELAEQARVGLLTRPDRMHDELAELDAWLAEHR